MEAETTGTLNRHGRRSQAYYVAHAKQTQKRWRTRAAEFRSRDEHRKAVERRQQATHKRAVMRKKVALASKLGIGQSHVDMRRQTRHSSK